MDYNDLLKEYAQGLDTPVKEDASKSVQSDMAYLTAKIDINCKLYCDGDFLDLLEAGKVKNFPFLSVSI